MIDVLKLEPIMEEGSGVQLKEDRKTLLRIQRIGDIAVISVQSTKVIEKPYPTVYFMISDRIICYIILVKSDF